DFHELFLYLIIRSLYTKAKRELLNHHNRVEGLICFLYMMGSSVLKKGTRLKTMENRFTVPSIGSNKKIKRQPDLRRTTFEDRKTYLDLELNLSSSSSSTIKTIVNKDESSKGKNLIMSPIISELR
ncbi:hypothetical protein HID58_065625, partial [Brassica napus]